MKILVVGSGGREHALVWALQRNHERSIEVFCAPGNAGIAQTAHCVPISATDIHALASFADENNIDLTIIGGETSLAAGIADEFATRGMAIIGPKKQAARLESSKAFAKDFMSRHRIPTARFRVADSIAEARKILERGEFGTGSIVVKADGLAAGKGVVVAHSPAEAEKAIEDLMSGASQTAEKRIVLEETLEGREASLLLWTDGRDYKLMPAARDHKRVGDGDEGPNTGGMGAVTAPDILDEETLQKIVRETIEPTLAGAESDCLEFRGVLFIGLMLTKEGARVLEYNVRFGDPEAQAILVRLQSDFLEINQAVARRELGRTQIEWGMNASACVVLAARGYPEKPETGALIDGLDTARGRNTNAQIFHAGTKRDSEGAWRTAGGRVLGITANGETLDRALETCYTTIDTINWEGMHYRRDIGRSSSQHENRSQGVE